jgi:hypothetical protein
VIASSSDLSASFSAQLSLPQFYYCQHRTLGWQAQHAIIVTIGGESVAGLSNIIIMYGEVKAGPHCKKQTGPNLKRFTMAWLSPQDFHVRNKVLLLQLLLLLSTTTVLQTPFSARTDSSPELQKQAWFRILSYRSL